MSLFASPLRCFFTGLGLALGLAVAVIWPHEQASAVATDRNEKFAMVTAPLGAVDITEGVFVLDFLTGQIRGAAMNSNVGQFTLFYARNIAADFNVNPNTPGVYTVAAGRTNLPSRGQYQPAASCLYIGELNSGKVVAYAFQYQNTNRVVPAPIALEPIANFQFREAVN